MVDNMSNPILYPSTETAFDTNGLGVLSDAVACTVTEERNGMFELEMQYPVSGVHYADIALRALILAKPNPTDNPQPFRVYRITKPMNGIVTVYAQHISYDLAGIPTGPFTAVNAPAAMAALGDNAAVPCPFVFWTDKDTAATIQVKSPASIRSLLGGVRGSILDTYGGEYAFDRYTVRLYAARGADRGVTIRYGKNLTSLEQDANCAAVYTGVYPYWADSDGNNLIQLPEKIVQAPGTYDFTRILTLDFSSEWQEKPTEEQLRARAERYIAENKVGVPKVSLEVQFAPLEQSEEYKHLAPLERVSLGDTVTVQFERLGVNATAKVVRTTHNVLTDRYDSIELGDARTNIADTIVQQQQAIAEKPSTSAMQAAMKEATAWLTNGKGYKVERRDAAGNTIDTLYMDTPDIATAVNVLRIGQSGIGFSRSGVNGPYFSAWTLAGAFNADFIATGTLNAAQVRVINLIADHLRSTSGTYTLDAWAAVFNLLDGSDLRARIYTTGTNPSGGLVQVFGGHHPTSGAQDDTSRYSYLSPTSLGVGETKAGKYIGSVYCNKISGCDQYLTSSGNAILSVDGGKRIGHFDKIGIGGAGAIDVGWTWDGNLGKFLLTASA